MTRFFLFSIMILLLPLSGFPEEKKVLSKEAEYMQLSKEISDYWVNSPLILNDSIIFFYKDEGKKILVAGDFNDWKPELLMDRRSTNFWQYSWEERLDKGTYKYKFLVDDIWIADPLNTNVMIDASGQPVSYFTLEEDFIPYAHYPLWYKKDIWEFRFEDRKARNVSLVGDFNNWNPYSMPMNLISGSEFSIRIRLKPGVHVYCFVVDGTWKPDPNNRKQYSDEVGNIVSILYIPEKKK